MASSLPPRSSYQKETAGPARREMGYKATPRQNVLWALNNAEANGGTTSVPADGGSTVEAAPTIKFSGRQDVERLLAEKMKDKSKSDFKGRVNQMSDYIKKLRVCIRWYMELVILLIFCSLRRSWLLAIIGMVV